MVVPAGTENTNPRNEDVLHSEREVYVRPGKPESHGCNFTVDVRANSPRRFRRQSRVPFFQRSVKVGPLLIVDCYVEERGIIAVSSQFVSLYDSLLCMCGTTFVTRPNRGRNTGCRLGHGSVPRLSTGMGTFGLDKRIRRMRPRLLGKQTRRTRGITRGLRSLVVYLVLSVQIETLSRAPMPVHRGRVPVFA